MPVGVKLLEIGITRFIGITRGLWFVPRTCWNKQQACFSVLRYIRQGSETDNLIALCLKSPCNVKNVSALKAEVISMDIHVYSLSVCRHFSYNLEDLEHFSIDIHVYSRSVCRHFSYNLEDFEHFPWIFTYILSVFADFFI